MRSIEDLGQRALRCGITLLCTGWVVAATGCGFPECEQLCYDQCDIMDQARVEGCLPSGTVTCDGDLIQGCLDGCSTARLQDIEALEANLAALQERLDLFCECTDLCQENCDLRDQAAIDMCLPPGVNACGPTTVSTCIGTASTPGCNRAVDDAIKQDDLDIIRDWNASIEARNQLIIDQCSMP